MLQFSVVAISCNIVFDIYNECNECRTVLQHIKNRALFQTMDGGISKLNSSVVQSIIFASFSPLCNYSAQETGKHRYNIPFFRACLMLNINLSLPLVHLTR